MAAHVKMYTRKWCGYCTAAQNLLDEKGIAYEHVDATNDPATRAWLVQATGRRTVPQIFIDGKPVGGYDDLCALERRGELDRLLAGSGADATT
jgi:glutaredoxin 3